MISIVTSHTVVQSDKSHSRWRLPSHSRVETESRLQTGASSGRMSVDDHPEDRDHPATSGGSSSVAGPLMAAASNSPLHRQLTDDVVVIAMMTSHPWRHRWRSRRDAACVVSDRGGGFGARRGPIYAGLSWLIGDLSWLSVGLSRLRASSVLSTGSDHATAQLVSTSHHLAISFTVYVASS